MRSLCTATREQPHLQQPEKNSSSNEDKVQPTSKKKKKKKTKQMKNFKVTFRLLVPRTKFSLFYVEVDKTVWEMCICKMQ